LFEERAERRQIIFPRLQGHGVDVVAAQSSRKFSFLLFDNVGQPGARSA
jgi:hypothetical protein